MPDMTQYSFTLREVGEALLKSANVTEGKWGIGVNFGINVANFGPTQAEAKPTVMAVVDGLQLTKAKDDDQAVGMVIDASKIDAS